MANLTKLVSKLTPGLKGSLESAVGISVKHKMKTVDVAAWIYCVIEDRDADLHTFLASQGPQHPSDPSTPPRHPYLAPT